MILVNLMRLMIIKLLFLSFSLLITGCVKNEPTYKKEITPSLVGNNMIFDTKKMTKKGLLKKVALKDNNFTYIIGKQNPYTFTSVYELPFLNKHVQITFYNSKIKHIEPLNNNTKKRKYIVNTPIIEEIE